MTKLTHRREELRACFESGSVTNFLQPNSGMHLPQKSDDIFSRHSIVYWTSRSEKARRHNVGCASKRPATVAKS